MQLVQTEDIFSLTIKCELKLKQVDPHLIQPARASSCLRICPYLHGRFKQNTHDFEGNCYLLSPVKATNIKMLGIDPNMKIRFVKKKCLFVRFWCVFFVVARNTIFPLGTKLGVFTIILFKSAKKRRRQITKHISYLGQSPTFLYWSLLPGTVNNNSPQNRFFFA